VLLIRSTLRAGTHLWEEVDSYKVDTEWEESGVICRRGDSPNLWPSLDLLDLSFLSPHRSIFLAEVQFKCLNGILNIFLHIYEGRAPRPLHIATLNAHHWKQRPHSTLTAT
jgi:hypothetical protein